ncbi:MAG: hypothetical protein ACUVTZ_02730 [Armatimonadota bacterium]
MSTRAVVLLALVCLLSVWIASAVAPEVYVKGYYTYRGTYVMPYYRSNPDGFFWNNWSTKGNINPYTGRPGHRTYESYLRSTLPTYSYRIGSTWNSRSYLGGYGSRYSFKW